MGKWYSGSALPILNPNTHALSSISGVTLVMPNTAGPEQHCFLSLIVIGVAPEPLSTT